MAVNALEGSSERAELVNMSDQVAFALEHEIGQSHWRSIFANHHASPTGVIDERESL
jgi:hypothetical protein